MSQTIIVSVILVACVAYTARRLWLRFSAAPSSVRCAGCPLAETCEHRHQTSCCHDEHGRGHCDSTDGSSCCQKVHKQDNKS